MKKSLKKVLSIVLAILMVLPQVGIFNGLIAPQGDGGGRFTNQSVFH